MAEAATRMAEATALQCRFHARVSHKSFGKGCWAPAQADTKRLSAAPTGNTPEMQDGTDVPVRITAVPRENSDWKIVQPHGGVSNEESLGEELPT